MSTRTLKVEEGLARSLIVAARRILLELRQSNRTASIEGAVERAINAVNMGDLLKAISPAEPAERLGEALQELRELVATVLRYG